MKSSLILLMLFFGSNLYGQTYSIEKDIFHKKLVDKEIDQNEFSSVWLKWTQTIKEIKTYPDLPLDQNGQVHYTFLNEFKNFDKEKLFNRTLEWLSINYNLIPANVYSNLKDGKIIFRNSLDLIKNYTCTYTSIISIKDEKIKMELTSIVYQVYLPEQTISFNINKVYPIILKDPSEWNSNLNLLKTTNELIDAETKNLCDYILSYDISNTF